jgi:hypothetical protein
MPIVQKNPQIINIPVAHDKHGNLSVVEGNKTIPFNIKRIYYLYDVPGGTKRGGHAHRSTTSEICLKFLKSIPLDIKLCSPA